MMSKIRLLTILLLCGFLLPKTEAGKIFDHDSLISYNAPDFYKQSIINMNDTEQNKP